MAEEKTPKISQQEIDKFMEESGALCSGYPNTLDDIGKPFVGTSRRRKGKNRS